MTEPDFASVIAAPPEYRPPELVDDELATLIAKRGSARAKVAIRNTWLLFALFVPVGFVAGLTNSNLVLMAVGLVAVFGWAITALRVASVSRAFKNQQYGKTAALLPSAMRWSAMMYPFTVFQLARCQTIEFQILLSEARWIELEILSRFLWAVCERAPITSGTPKNWAVANNLAVAYMLQYRYAEAARLFSMKISSATGKRNRLVLLNNLAFCQARDHQLDAAEATLSQAFALLGASITADVSPRLRYIRALVQLERGQLDEAEHSVDEAVSIGQKQKVPVELQAACMALLAQIRHKQGRREESELHFRNAIDFLSATNNPHYIGLAQYLHCYAQLQYEMGNIEGARQSMEKARSYHDHYVTRETATVANIKAHLMNEKKLCTTTTLLKLANREPLLEMQS